MSIDSIQHISSPYVFGDTNTNLISDNINNGVSKSFENYIGELNSQLDKSEKLLQGLATGEEANIHEVMISLEKAKLSMELMLQVRNKSLEAYQEIMRTQL